MQVTASAARSIGLKCQKNVCIVFSHYIEIRTSSSLNSYNETMPLRKRGEWHIVACEVCQFVLKTHKM